MKTWQEDLLDLLHTASSETELFGRIKTAARSLGFDYCAYGMRLPLPLASPKVTMLSNYPAGWQARYVEGKMFAIDPTVIHGLRSQEPVLWSESLFASAPTLWDEAQAFGLRVGWAQSSLGAPGPRSMLTLARSSMPISPSELSANEMKMRWLLNVAHQSMARILAPRHRWQLQSTLTAREVEVLKWTADGKTMAQISDILKLSDNTVKFHIRNAVTKLQATTKTAAVVRAAMLGWLD